MFDWIDFLQRHNIHYVTSGPNVAKNDVAVRCPFCGSADPSQHLAININGAGWHCWRNREHKGKSPVRLIQGLLGCSHEQARMLAGQNTTIPDDFLGHVLAQMTPNASAATTRVLTIPPEFKTLRDTPTCRPYLRYLRDRGFKHPLKLDLYYCTKGPYHGRIIFPIHFEGKLVTWTGRTIVTSETLRYKSLSPDPEKAKKEGYQALGPIGHYLLGFDDLVKNPGDTICMVEGPFDALKVNYLGQRHGIQATCFFTNSPSVNQIDLLHELLPLYRRRVLLLDQGTMPIAIRTQNLLTGLDVELVQLPAQYKDPGEISLPIQLLQLLT
jgi:hypothetical protein